MKASDIRMLRPNRSIGAVLAPSFALRRSDPGLFPGSDEHHWRDILTTDLNLAPRLPGIASSGCLDDQGGL